MRAHDAIIDMATNLANSLPRTPGVVFIPWTETHVAVRAQSSNWVRWWALEEAQKIFATYGVPYENDNSGGLGTVARRSAPGLQSTPLPYDQACKLSDALIDLYERLVEDTAWRPLLSEGTRA